MYNGVSLNTKGSIDSRNEKIKKTNLEKYGTDHLMKTEEWQEKIKGIMQERYGVDYALQNEEILEKTRQTNQERYGVDRPSQLPEVREKMKKTTLERYEVEHYNQLPEMKDYLRENCTTWLAESYKNPWAKGFKKPQEWTDKAKNTIADKIIKGEWFAGYKTSYRGKYKSKKCKKPEPQYRSSFELLYHYYLDNNDDVIWYDYEFCKIKYLHEDETEHYYIPDFIVGYKNNTIIVKEVKADFMAEDINNISKKNAAVEYFTQHGIGYELVLKKEIESYNLDLDKILNLPEVTQY